MCTYHKIPMQPKLKCGSQPYRPYGYDIEIIATRHWCYVFFVPWKFPHSPESLARAGNHQLLLVPIELAWMGKARLLGFPGAPERIIVKNTEIQAQGVYLLTISDCEQG